MKLLNQAKSMNKKTILTLALIIIGLLSANAQIGKGSIAIGSTVIGSFSQSENKSTALSTYITSTNDTIISTLNIDRDISIWSLNINPNFEYFIKDNLSIGFGFGYHINQSKTIIDYPNSGFYKTTITNTIERYIPEIYINKYWFITPKFSFNIRPSINSFYNEITSYNNVENPAFSQNQRANTQITSNWYHTINCPFGINYFIANKWMLGLQTNLFQYKYERNFQSFNFFGSNISLSLGINYFVKQKPIAKTN